MICLTCSGAIPCTRTCRGCMKTCRGSLLQRQQPPLRQPQFRHARPPRASAIRLIASLKAWKSGHATCRRVASAFELCACSAALGSVAPQEQVMFRRVLPDARRTPCAGTVLVEMWVAGSVGALCVESRPTLASFDQSSAKIDQIWTANRIRLNPDWAKVGHVGMVRRYWPSYTTTGPPRPHN